MPTLVPVPGLTLLLLGGFDARLNGHPVTGISYNKMRALLAYLAMEREQDHKREVLAELLWRGNDPATARGNLRRTLSDLRRVLELPNDMVLFATSKHTIRFKANGYIDVLDFTAPAPISAHEGADCAACADHDKRIAALYHGEFLAGLSLPDSPAFEDWLQLQRETLRRRALGLLEQLSNRHALAGDYLQALPFALRSVALDPWDELACRRAMRLYALDGQHSAALALYADCCRLLKQDLELLPNEETRQLADNIRSGASGGIALPTMQDPPLTIRAPPPAQRSQVTVLYCELTLAAMDDPEEAVALLALPQGRCLAIIRQFSGHVVQTHGGGLLAYFGYPHAHEDAPRHAVQAALQISHEATVSLHINTGIHTGLVISGGTSSLPDVDGQTTRLALHLSQSAGPNEVTLSQQSHALVAGYFDCLPLNMRPLTDGLPALEAFKLLRESGARTRLDSSAQLSPWVGRQAELTQLLGLWDASKQGRPQIALLQGEAGMGKSRLLLTLKERLADQLHTVRELRCFPEFSQSPFQPLIAMLETIFGFTHADTPEVKGGQLLAHLQTFFPALAPQAVPLLGQLLSLPLVGPYPAPAFSPQKQKAQTITILLALLRARSEHQPVLLIVEDLHWVDPSTLDLLTLFIAQKKSAAILALLTARPVFVPPWKDALHATLVLAPLRALEVTKMITALRPGMADATLQRIVERADGVPLFIEEITKIATLDPQTRIPSTLHDLLVSRMDRLGQAKYTAQLAATLGRAFNLDLLRKVFPNGSVALAQSLKALRAADLISTPKDAVCQFKHALIQEAAYQSQTKSTRQAAHQRIARTLQSDFPDIARQQPELVAQHWSAGGETRQAVDYWIKAGQRAALQLANVEALGHFHVGLQQVMTLAPAPERDALEFVLQVNLGATLCATQGYGAVEAGAAYARALVLGEALGDGPGLFKALWGLWLGASSRVGHEHALELARRLLRLAQHGADPLELQKAHYAMGNSLLWTGRLGAARIHQEQAMALYQPAHHDRMVQEIGENICVSTGSQLVWVLWLQGFADQAQAVAEQTLALAREVKHPYSRCYAKAHVMGLNRWLKQVTSTRQLAEETIALAHEHGFPLWLLSGLSLQGWALSMQGNPRGITQLRQGVETVRCAMSGIEAFFLAPLVEAQLHLGHWAPSLSAANAALAVASAKDDRFLESEFFRLKGESLLGMRPGDTAEAEAEACFGQALLISRQQGAKSLELRAGMSLARLRQRQGRNAEAHQTLHAIYKGFTEGFDSADLQEARGLLQALQGTRAECLVD